MIYIETQGQRQEMAYNDILTKICLESRCGSKWNGYRNMRLASVETKFMMSAMGINSRSLGCLPPARFRNNFFTLQSNRKLERNGKAV